MATAVVDVIAPKVLIVPRSEDIIGGVSPQISGMLIMSGAHLEVWTGAAWTKTTD